MHLARVEALDGGGAFLVLLELARLRQVLLPALQRAVGQVVVAAGLRLGAHLARVAGAGGVGAARLVCHGRIGRQGCSGVGSARASLAEGKAPQHAVAHSLTGPAVHAGKGAGAEAAK